MTAFPMLPAQPSRAAEIGPFGDAAPVGTLEVVEDGTLLLVRAAVLDGPDEEIASLQLNTSKALEGAQEKIRKILDGFKNDCADVDEDNNVEWPALEKAFADLRTQGQSLVDQMLGVNGPELANILERLLPGWQIPEGRGRTVEIICDRDFLLPIEFFPLLGYDSCFGVGCVG